MTISFLGGALILTHINIKKLSHHKGSGLGLTLERREAKYVRKHHLKVK